MAQFKKFEVFIIFVSGLKIIPAYLMNGKFIVFKNQNMTYEIVTSMHKTLIVLTKSYSRLYLCSMIIIQYYLSAEL